MCPDEEPDCQGSTPLLWKLHLEMLVCAFQAVRDFGWGTGDPATVQWVSVSSAVPWSFLWAVLEEWSLPFGYLPAGRGQGICFSLRGWPQCPSNCLPWL